ncbi:hypothetical protein IFM89_036322 [Coptis chinensis]|uniref:Uncharacterized protein n=1 Tax=Coptis chinensis TaxID=261450 RepID=A0A835IGI9_9MAGN|nr:hypothetical protein IFM89_036322 [Coptis chinensis]
MFFFERVEKYAVMFMRIFGKPNQETKVLTYWDKVDKALERHKKEENDYLEKISAEVEMAKEFSRAKNKRGAIHCLRRKRVYEQQVEHLEKCQLLILNQLTKLTLIRGVAVMEAMQKAVKIDGMIEQTEDSKLILYALLTPIGSFANFDETDDLKLIQDALSTPLSSSADFDLHELEAELKELEKVDLVEQLPAVSQPTNSIAKKRTAEELLALDRDDSGKRKRQN